MSRIIKRGYVPLLFLSESSLLCFAHGQLRLINVDSLKENDVCSLPLDNKRKILSYSRIFARRFGVNEIKAVGINQKKVLIFYHHRYYILNLDDKTITCVDAKSDYPMNALYLSHTSMGVLVGEYGYNPNKEARTVYRLNETNDSFVPIYTFRKGEINHIHNIIEDNKTGRIWVFTGDFDDSAAIYYTDDKFATLTRSVFGNQLFRCCCGVSINNTLYYATDTPTFENHICKLKDGVVEKQHTLNGSCIYGVAFGSSLLLSSTVENQPNELDNTVNKYRYNLGSGIKDWYVEIVLYNTCNDTYRVLLRTKKDFLPMMPYKFGCYRFPSNLLSDRAVAYGQAIRKYDQKLISVDMSDMT